MQKTLHCAVNKIEVAESKSSDIKVPSHPIPHEYALSLTFTTDAKLSSKIMISELSLATSVPEIPMERPISAWNTGR